MKRRLTKTTNRLQRHIEAIRNREITHSGLEHLARCPTGMDDLDPGLSPRRLDARLTQDYPTQGKLQSLTTTQVGHTEWEPAESLYIAILVGPDELASGLLRHWLTAQRRQRHDAMVYRWQGEFTLDVLGFDAIDHKKNRDSGHVDMVLLSDRILGNTVGRTPIHDLERVALKTRLRFRDSYLVGLIADRGTIDLTGHAFHSIEHKVRAKGITVFDQHLVGLVDQERITRLLVSYAKSRRYAADRSVWLTPDGGDVPLPIPKEDVPHRGSDEQQP